MTTFWIGLAVLWAFALLGRFIRPRTRLKVMRHRLDDTTEIVAVTQGHSVVWIGSYSKSEDGDDADPDWVQDLSTRRN